MSGFLQSTRLSRSFRSLRFCSLDAKGSAIGEGRGEKRDTQKRGELAENSYGTNKVRLLPTSGSLPTCWKATAAQDRAKVDIVSNKEAKGPGN